MHTSIVHQMFIRRDLGIELEKFLVLKETGLSDVSDLPAPGRQTGIVPNTPSPLPAWVSFDPEKTHVAPVFSINKKSARSINSNKKMTKLLYIKFTTYPEYEKSFK
jgi:hypothetical protein